MKIFSKFKNLAVLISAGLLSSQVIAQCDRQEMVEEYERFFLGTRITGSDLGWTGNATTCIAGQIADPSRKKTLDRINYYRRLAKLPTEVGFDDNLTSMCQQAALMMHSHNQLSHEPDLNWTCYSEDGKKAAGKSNLALGAHSAEAIALYMVDPGANNGAVGHRRWILYSRAKDFGMGSTSRANALYVIHNKITEPENLEFIAYPSPGFFPAPLLPDRWSLSVPGANFDLARVTMYDEKGQSLPLELQPIKNGFGDNTLVWEVPAGTIEKFGNQDHSFQVSVENIIVKGIPKMFAYEVVVAAVIHPPLCSDNFNWSEADCSCIDQQVTSTGTDDSGTFRIQIQPNPADHYLQVQLPQNWGGKAVEVHMIDLMGKLVFKQKLSEDIWIDTQSFPSGLYQVRFVHPTFKQNLRVLIKH